MCADRATSEQGVDSPSPPVSEKSGTRQEAQATSHSEGATGRGFDQPTEAQLVPYDKITVIFQRAEEGGWWMRVEEMPGCLSQGEDFAESVLMIQDAMAGWLEP